MHAKTIYDLTPFSSLDFYGKLSAIVWFSGCNMRCAYCYNPDIVLGKATLCAQEVLDFLKTRQGLLEAVVLSGGEATLFKDIFPFCKRIKEMGFLLKLDTNGLQPKVLQQLLKERLLDYVALDFKALSTGFHTLTKSKDFSAFEQSLDILLKSKLKFEIRTTVHSDYLDEAQLNTMSKYLQNKGYQGTYYLQNYLHTQTLANTPKQRKVLNIQALKEHVPLGFRNF